MILRHGDTAPVLEDSGRAIVEIAEKKKIILPEIGGGVGNLFSLFSQLRVKQPSVNFGHPEGVLEGSCYSRRHLYAMNAHRADQRGVNGNVLLGCDSIVVSRQSSDCREEDGERKWYHIYLVACFY